ncbi:MAG: ScpA family protein [Parvibaculum sp.]|uniref:segregation and condensation protein A n=1 Tax=Parvibaculum sp. TaxID=2024848 RepID=UPI003C756575
MNEAPSHNEAEAGAPAAGLVAHPEGGSAEGAPVSGESFEEGRPIAAPEAEADQESLIVDLDGFEGPLDVLLTLARNQKVDLTRISILQLAEQYLDFINRAHRMELDLAADYLVMASWLAYLKSRLLLPPPEEEEGPSGAEMAARLAFQLQRLESMRNASQALFARQRLGIHVFQRGMPEGIRIVKTSEYQGSLFELLKAYSEQRLKGRETRWEPKRLPILAIEIARKRLENMLGMMFDWGRIDALLPADFMTGELRRSALASTLSAALVLAKDGEIEIAQAGAYQPLFVRRKRPGEGSAPMPADDTDDQQIEE